MDIGKKIISFKLLRVNRIFTYPVVLAGLLIYAYILFADFNIANAIVPEDEILSGGPPKDGIPAILNPKFVEPGLADFLNPNDQVIVVKLGKESRAYPIKILNHHEVVNDTLDNVPIAVTF